MKDPKPDPRPLEDPDDDYVEMSPFWKAVVWILILIMIVASILTIPNRNNGYQ